MKNLFEDINNNDAEFWKFAALTIIGFALFYFVICIFV